MNIRILLLSFLFIGFSCQSSYGQLFKKIKNKAKQAVEEVIVRKTADKAASIAGNGMDKLFNVDFGSQIDPSILPEYYDFEWKYTMQMVHKKGTMNMTYYLKKGAKYFGTQPELEQNTMANGMFIVFDEGLDIMAFFMETENGKGGHVLQNPTASLDSIANQETNALEGTSYTTLGTKTILGYTCQGFQMENDELKMTMYIAMDAPVSFNQVYGGMQQKALPEGFDSKWLDKAENSIMMEMTIVNKKKKKYNAKMTCVTLEKSPKTLVVADYEFMNVKTETSKKD